MTSNNNTFKTIYQKWNKSNSHAEIDSDIYGSITALAIEYKNTRHAVKKKGVAMCDEVSQSQQWAFTSVFTHLNRVSFT